MAVINKVFGPPGSGKTTHLLGIVDRELAEGVSSLKIGYFSFTRKAAIEAKERAIVKFPGLNEKTDFPYFRTLHSLAFHCLSVHRDDMMQPLNYKEFALEAGIELSLAQEEEDVAVLKADNPILNEINLARIRGTDLKEHYNQSGLDIEWHHFEFVDRTYRHYKNSRSLLDFTDLLELVVQEADALPMLEVLIIDEAQDLSRLQWDMVNALVQRSKRVFIAGDDDQAVFVWAGADVKSFLAFNGSVTVLEQSYRVPVQVHALAEDIVQRIQERQPKTWRPRDFDGSVLTYSRFEDVTIDDGEWLVMASTNYLLNPIHEWFKSTGLLFERGGVNSLPISVTKAIADWERLRLGQSIGEGAVRNVYRYLGTDFIAKGHKGFKKGLPDMVYNHAELCSDHGLLTALVWNEALTKISDDNREYFMAVLRRGRRFSPVRLSTIHGAKGGEADNVLLLMDLSTKFSKEYAVNSDNLNRLFYVGVTRTKKALHLVLPRNTERGFRL